MEGIDISAKTIHTSWRPGETGETNFAEREKHQLKREASSEGLTDCRDDLPDYEWTNCSPDGLSALISLRLMVSTPYSPLR